MLTARTEAAIIKDFYKEFCEVVRQNYDASNNIYLVDVLE
jgi:hypothetical protein